VEAKILVEAQGTRVRLADEYLGTVSTSLKAFGMVGKPLPTSLHAGVDTAVIALWLGHADIRSTNVYLQADMAIKQKALDLTTPASSPPGRYRPPDPLLAFLESL
jgi:hypothetical protein